ncbi:hypothetical protein Vretimale_245 [Volvox reticuliferus]|uniref:Lipoxygenase homology domain-containing protein 1 n=4 Tax=Volvox reticuliferus TaxID=1737510 RepID=A0A8J4D2G4_9CHLO|nr:hypothetical protein Vretimale_245 [Volvox reticuliferus]
MDFDDVDFDNREPLGLGLGAEALEERAAAPLAPSQRPSSDGQPTLVDPPTRVASTGSIGTHDGPWHADPFEPARQLPAAEPSGLLRQPSAAARSTPDPAAFGLLADAAEVDSSLPRPTSSSGRPPLPPGKPSLLHGMQASPSRSPSLRRQSSDTGSLRMGRGELTFQMSPSQDKTRYYGEQAGTPKLSKRRTAEETAKITGSPVPPGVTLSPDATAFRRVTIREERHRPPVRVLATGDVYIQDTPMDGPLLSKEEEDNMAKSFRSGIVHAGYLHKLVGKTPLDVHWKKYWFYVSEDRLYYTGDEKNATRVRYICLDRVPVRPLPHSRTPRKGWVGTVPDIGIALVDPVNLHQKPGFPTPIKSPRGNLTLGKSSVIGLVSGSHTYFLAASSHEEAMIWLKVLRETWYHCFKHTLRASNLRSQQGLHLTSKVMAENIALRESVRDLAAKAQGFDSEYWRQWLEEKARNRFLEQRNADMAIYEVEVKTGKMKGASTDARVYMEMYAPHEEGVSTGELRLLDKDTHAKPFGRGALDLFLIPCRNVGLPNRIKVWHDNTGRRPDWFLEYIRIRKKGSINWTVFPCQRWFSTHLDDCRISRILFAGHATPYIQYKVVTYTSDIRGAGTDANVHFVMHGALGDGARHILSSGTDDFERGMVNEFIIDDEDLGDLLEITIGHDNTGHGPSWHLDHVEVTNLKTNVTYLFPCRMWFDTRVGDGALERTLQAADSLMRMAGYVFYVYTSDIRGAGTDADVFIVLHGEHGDTPATVLPSQLEHFERGQTDTFRLELPYVGKLRALTIGHNNKGENPDWHLLMVEVAEEEEAGEDEEGRPGVGIRLGPITRFVCNKWIGLGHPDPDSGSPEGVLQRTLRPGGEDPRLEMTDYRMEFHTGDVRGAGTDATVSFVLTGERGDSGPVKIDAPLEAFERGCIDAFTFRMRRLGRLRRLVLSHDNTGKNPAWFLLKVVVTSSHPEEPETTVFICNRWLQDANRAVHPSVELLPGGELPPVMHYKVAVTTSDIKGAGTESKVYLELIGAAGPLGPIHLDNPAAFERGATDTFILDGPDLGELLCLRVTCDGSGMRPLWHLDHIDVWRSPEMSDPETAVYFPCRAWFNKDSGFVKELYPGRRTDDVVKIPYTLKVYTGDLKNAGTDANICINLQGERGESGYVPLVANYDTFERAQVDAFDLMLPDVGRPLFLLVKSDGSSRKPTWYMDFAELTSENIPLTYFIAGMWLGPETGLEIRIPAGLRDPRAGRVEYLVQVYTSDIKNAGTDAGVWIELIGDQLTSGRQALIDTSKDTFERAQVDDFKVICQNLGPLRSIRVWHDGKGKPWHLDMVVVTAPTGEKYYFQFANWLGPSNPMAEILAGLKDPRADLKNYKVVVRTSDLPGAGTDANVYCELRGTRNNTTRHPLNNRAVNCFERGKVDEFEVKAEDLGGLREMLIGHDNTGIGPGWHLEQVEVTDPATNQTWFFDCNQWLDTKEGDGRTERLLPASVQNPRNNRVTYKLRVKTSDRPGAGTDANVYIDLRGDLGSTGKTLLKNRKLNNFERNNFDDFQITTRNLGPLKEMLVGHDDTGLGPAWHLEYIEAFDSATGVTWYFDCNAWLSSTEEDCRLERILPASLENPANKRTNYRVLVVTSDRAGAGTDANVFIDIFGVNGTNTGRVLLNNKGNDFERGQSDTFTIAGRDVGPMKKIRIGHDNSGIGAAWHLNRVEVTNLKTGEHRIFPANCWFSKKHDDFQIERDLYPGDVPDLNVAYEIVVVTSDLPGAGTDANVYVQMYGTEGEAGPLRLDNPKNNFEAGDTDVFNIRAPDCGDLQKIRLYHDNKGFGAAWHCEIVIITNKARKRTWFFYCGQWLDATTGLERILQASDTDPRASLVKYTVTTHTSDIKGAGTDANVCMEMYGTKGRSGVRELTGKGNLFERGKSDTFVYKMPDLGDLTELEIWHDGTGFGAGWHLDYVEVHSSATGKVYYFPCGRWLDTKEDDGAIRRRLQVSYKDPRSFKAQYRVSVTTSNIRGAGTDANVFIQMFGDEGETGRIKLDNPGKNDFERGNTDVFLFEDKNVGNLRKIRIGHDGAGLGAGWHLQRVVVENLTTGQVVVFDVNRWFDRSEDDGAIERDLYPTQGAAPGDNAVNWRLVVVTANVSGAGTDADVSVTLHGDKANFGPYTLPAPKEAFETGSTDTFSLTTPELGRIQALTIGHNNKGFGAAWCLSRVELENMNTGERYIFNFNNAWLDTKNGTSRTMAPSSYDNKMAGTSGRETTDTMAKAGEGKANYRLELATGLGPEGAMVDGRVMVDIIGADDHTGRQLLEMPEEGFQPARVEEFGLAGLPMVGAMRQLELVHAGSRPWEVRYVKVHNETNGEKAIFVPDGPLYPGVPSLLTPWTPLPCDYRVEVQTGDTFGAGTNARISINIFGEMGSTGRTELKYDGMEPGGGGGGSGACGDVCATKPFRRSALDVFTVRGLQDTGDIRQIEIGHDDTGAGSAWFLSWVRVTNLTTGASAYFLCDSWLARNKGDGFTRRLLTAMSNVDPTHPNAGTLADGTATAHVTVSPREGPPLGLMPLHDPLDPAAAAGLARKLAGGGVGGSGYKITLHTSNMCMAGTGAGVFFELIGEYGSSGTVMVQATPQQFSRGSSDTFIYPRLPFLGELLQLRVGTTGAGCFATWHLRQAEVVHLATGTRYVFNCHNWIDKKVNWQRVLTATAAPPVAVAVGTSMGV